MATKTRNLKDLFVVGGEITLDDGKGPVTVWLQKLSPLDSEIAIRKANAARARFMMDKDDPESDRYLAILNDVIDLSKEEFVQFLSSQDVVPRMEALEAELAEEKGWTKDDYLQGLRDSWTADLEERYLSQEENGPDEEAQKCYDELQKFQQEFEKRVEGEREAAAVAYEDRPVTDLRETAVERLFKLQADLAWLLEFRKCEIWLGVRAAKDDPDTKAFRERKDIDRLAPEAVQKLIEAYTGLNVPVIEGKDSPPMEPSSPASKRRGTQAKGSGPKDVTQ